MRKKKKREAEEIGLFPEEQQSTQLMPVDVQQREFRVGFRGYKESEVDEFLDEVTEELGRLHEEVGRLRDENQRPRAGSQIAPTSPFAGGAELAEAHRAADDIVRRAREQAATILRDAEARSRSISAGATAGGGGGDPTALSPFLAREREFLQGLATLIQGHAEFVKTTAKTVRRSVVPAAPSGLVAPVAAAGLVVPTAAPTPSPQPAPAPAAEPNRVMAAPEPEPVATAPEPEPVESEPEWPLGDNPQEGATSAAPEAEPGSGDRTGGPEGLFGVPEPEPAGAGEDLPTGQGAEPEAAAPREEAGGAGRGEGTPPERNRDRETSGGEPTQAWENPFAGPEGASSVEEPRAGSRSVDSHMRPAKSGEGPQEDRSLRELFWGEE